MNWQPIETAPKDYGKNVLLFGNGPNTWQSSYVGCWYEKDGVYGWHSLGEGMMSPTHWMPLPEPPK